MDHNDNKLSESAYICGECKAGVLHLEYITYFTWLDEELITVPSFPAWICDMCGRREYDPRAISWLNILLNPSTGRRTTLRGRRRPRPSSLDLPQP
jgi:YgiT-type zinc finger domain-containing protein